MTKNSSVLSESECLSGSLRSFENGKGSNSANMYIAQIFFQLYGNLQNFHFDLLMIGLLLSCLNFSQTR